MFDVIIEGLVVKDYYDWKNYLNRVFRNVRKNKKVLVTGCTFINKLSNSEKTRLRSIFKNRIDYASISPNCKIGILP